MFDVKNVTLVNLTHRRITFNGEGGQTTIDPSGKIAVPRSKTDQRSALQVGPVLIPVYHLDVFEVVDMPEPEKGKMFIVYPSVRKMLHRADLLSWEPVRDERGTPTGNSAFFGNFTDNFMAT